MASVPLEQPVTCTRAQVWHFVGFGLIDGLEYFHLLVFADKNPGVALLGLFQPEAVVFAAHGCAITGQAWSATEG